MDADEPGTIVAPWTPEQVEALNAYQHAGRFHPFTCPNRGSWHIDHGDGATGLLVATTDGWICRGCDYRQDWAHAFMAESTATGSGANAIGTVASTLPAGGHGLRRPWDRFFWATDAAFGLALLMALTGVSIMVSNDHSDMAGFDYVLVWFAYLPTVPLLAIFQLLAVSRRAAPSWAAVTATMSALVGCYWAWCAWPDGQTPAGTRVLLAVAAAAHLVPLAWFVPTRRSRSATHDARVDS